ncbi:MAG: histidine kinase [Acidobacteria bacterium]|nr:histidine kinase [Acidobacteriota bacterium]
MYRTVSLLVYTFGLAAFLGLFVLWLRQFRLGRPELREWHYPAIFLSSAAWFALNLLTLEYFVLLAAACVFPPLLARLFGARGVLWIGLGSAGVAAASLLYQAGGLALQNPRRDLSAAYCLFFVLGCVSAARRAAGGRLNLLLLLGAMVVVPVAMVTFEDWLSLAMRSLPLTILVIDSYARRRFLFLDLFAKWGSYFAVALTALTMWFRLLPESLNPIQSAVLFLPVVWGVPRLCRTIGMVLDRRLLGRPFTSTEAQRIFLETLQTAADEAELRKLAAALLEKIFHTPVSLSEEGRITMAPSPQGRPLFSEDMALLENLDGTLRFLVENRRLEARRSDLMLAASRSELKALRAQVDPHFLFNALNTVAGLIPSNPALAESTVEKLAEVFRYALRRSEDEIVPLSEEMDFIRAWLDIQQVRFGERLAVSIEASSELLERRIPAMMLQTLVENAVKHAVARSTKACRVTIRAAATGSALRLTVTDDGPGPTGMEESQGHGLRNARQRLAGYYGDRASLTLTRDDRAGETVATLEIPL